MSVENGRRIAFEGGTAGLVPQSDGTVQLAYQLRHDGVEKRVGDTIDLEGAAHRVLSYGTSKFSKNMVVLKLKRVEAPAS